MCCLYRVWALHRNAISSGFSWMLSPAGLRALMQHCLCGNNHWHVPAELRRAMRLLRGRKHVNSLGLAEVVYLFCLSFNVHLIKCLYFSTFAISSNKLDEMVYGFRFCRGMAICTSPRLEPATQEENRRMVGTEAMNPWTHLHFMWSVFHVNYISVLEVRISEGRNHPVCSENNFTAWIKGKLETGFQRDAGKVPQSDCGQQIFRQLRGLYRSECLSYWIDCLQQGLYLYQMWIQSGFILFFICFPEFQATNILSWRLKK